MKRNENFFETRMVSDLSSSAVVKTQIPRVSCPPTSTLKSLIEEQTKLNEQGLKKMPPCLLIEVLSKSINEQGGIFRLLQEKL